MTSTWTAKAIRMILKKFPTCRGLRKEERGVGCGRPGTVLRMIGHRALRKRSVLALLLEVLDGFLNSFLCDSLFLTGLFSGSLMMFLFLAPYSINESCEASYPTLALWKDRVWAFFEAKFFHPYLYRWFEYEQNEMTKLIKEEAVKAATGNPGLGAPTSIGTFFIFWTWMGRGAT